MRPRLCLAPLASLLLVLAGPAAGADEEFGRSGAYASVTGAWAIEQFSGERPRDYDNAVGLSLRGGYRALPYLAGELQWEYLPEFDDRRVSGAKLLTHAVTGNVKAIFPEGPLQLYALGGIGFLHADPSGGGSAELDLMTRFGGGLDIYFGDNVYGTLEGTYVLPFDKVNGLDYISLIFGLGYRF